MVAACKNAADSRPYVSFPLLGLPHIFAASTSAQPPQVRTPFSHSLLQTITIKRTCQGMHFVIIPHRATHSGPKYSKPPTIQFPLDSARPGAGLVSLQSTLYELAGQ
eukprot:3316937-Amphidinium_carterae.2